MTEMQCPYCGTARSTSRLITAQTKARCPNCKNVFRPLPRTTASDSDLSVIPLELELDEPLVPPPPSAPLGQPKPEPQPEQLYGNRPMPTENARKSLAIGLGICSVALAALFGTWYVHQVHTLDKMADKAAYRNIAKIKNFAAPFAAQNQKLAMPALPVAQQQPVAPQPASQPAQRPFPQQQFNRAVPLANQPAFQAPAPKVEPAPKAVPAKRPTVIDPADEKKATSKLYMANKLEKEGKVRLANKLYQEIIDAYPGSEAAETAQSKVGYSLDQRVEKAAKMLVLGLGFEKLNSLDEARAEYTELIARYPETEQAKQAKKRLKALNKK
jgi:tetratricopeptide (TPR) repeat protein